jgi:hypothetical protein
MDAYRFGFGHPRRRFLRIAFWRYGGSLALVLAVMCQSGWAQASISDWKNLKALDPGSGIWVRTVDGGKLHGELVALTDDELSLNTDERHFPGRRSIQRHLPRERVKEVRRFSQWLPGAVGAAIGGGIGAGIGAGLDASVRGAPEDPHICTFIFGFLGALFGGLFASDSTFIKGKTIYRAP